MTAPAKAKLIAAAPELYAALEVTEAALCDLFEDLKAYGDHSRTTQFKSVINTCAAALAKARGENPNKDVKAHDPMNAYPQGRWSNPA